MDILGRLELPALKEWLTASLLLLLMPLTQSRINELAAGQGFIFQPSRGCAEQIDSSFQRGREREREREREIERVRER